MPSADIAACDPNESSELSDLTSGDSGSELRGLSETLLQPPIRRCREPANDLRFSSGSDSLVGQTDGQNIEITLLNQFGNTFFGSTRMLHSSRLGIKGSGIIQRTDEKTHPEESVLFVWLFCISTVQMLE